MASMQRSHWVSLVLQCLLLSLLLCRNGIFANRNKYYHISTLCARERFQPHYKIVDGAILTSEGEEDQECVITFQTDSILQKFMLRFEHLELDCNDHLYIFDGDHAFGNYKVDLSCRSTRADVGTIFMNSNYVTLKYKTDRSTHKGNGFRLVVTSFKDSSSGCRDFKCLNNFCLSRDIVCDGINHCGDNSDETSYAHCQGAGLEQQILGVQVGAFIAVVVTAVVLCAACVAGLGIYLCRRLKPSHRSPATPCEPPPGPVKPDVYADTSTPLEDKPPPYPGTTYTGGGQIGYQVSKELLYYPAIK